MIKCASFRVIAVVAKKKKTQKHVLQYESKLTKPLVSHIDWSKTKLMCPEKGL